MRITTFREALPKSSVNCDLLFFLQQIDHSGFKFSVIIADKESKHI